MEQDKTARQQDKTMTGRDKLMKTAMDKKDRHEGRKGRYRMRQNSKT